MNTTISSKNLGAINVLKERVAQRHFPKITVKKDEIFFHGTYIKIVTVEEGNASDWLFTNFRDVNLLAEVSIQTETGTARVK